MLAAATICPLLETTVETVSGQSQSILQQEIVIDFSLERKRVLANIHTIRNGREGL